MRSVPEWVGKTDDAAIPKRVKLRIFERCGGKCGLTGAKIMVGDAYDFDHIKALWEGGEHREFNLHPVLRAPHRIKSAADQTRQAKADRTRFKHITRRDQWPSKGPKLRGRGFSRRWSTVEREHE